MIPKNFGKETVTTSRNVQYKLYQRNPKYLLNQQISSVSRSSLSIFCRLSQDFVSLVDAGTKREFFLVIEKHIQTATNHNITRGTFEYSEKKS